MPPLLKLLRPHQWSKNIFVFAGLIFGHAWSNSAIVIQVIIAAIAFSLIASSMYIFNDMLDRKIDYLHPTKRHRPLAAGTIKPTIAIALATALTIVGLILSFVFTLYVGWILLAYIIINIAYTLQLKKWIIIDVFVISAGFILRILAGTTGVGIPPSHWLLLCTMLLTLFLGFCKRRAEQRLHTASYQASWQTGPHYPRTLLNKLITITATSSILSYLFYTLHQDSLAPASSSHLIYTTPIVIYGIFRYLYLQERDRTHHTGIDIAHDIIHDRQLFTIVIIWLLATIWLGVA